MKISDLAALVAVRNHILTVINDNSVTSRDEFQPLNKVRIALDKKFVEILKSLSYKKDDKIEVNLDGIFKPLDYSDMVSKTNHGIASLHQEVSISDLNIKKDKQLHLPFDITKALDDNLVDSIAVEVDKSAIENLDIETKQEKPSDGASTVVVQDPELADALAKAKSDLKKQGRSNKKVSKENDKKG